MKWSEGKTKQEIRDELYRELETYELNNLIESLLDVLNPKQCKEWVNQWHKEDS